MRPTDNSLCDLLILNQMNQDDYNLHYSEQNATVDFTPPFEMEQLYSKQFRQMLNFFATETVPVADNNRFDVASALTNSQCEIALLSRDFERICKSEPSDQLHSVLGLSPYVNGSRFSSTIKRFAIYKQERGAYSAYLKSESVCRMRFNRKLVRLDLIELIHMSRRGLQIFSTRFRQYLLRTGEST